MRDSSDDSASSYVEALSLLERLHRLLLDVVKDEFERLGVVEINAVQALLLFNIGDNVVTAGELRSRGYYQGSNVSYNLKKLVEAGFIHHERCASDKRSVRVRLTQKGQDVRSRLDELFARHEQALDELELVPSKEVTQLTLRMRQLERFWSDQIRFIY